ncbi:DNA mismatch repair endonuclease MutL [Tunicatimonas pelagia]|uniref:DNA mismatch repair endonuclease MutL n=1 Tax=Tunicatimonas pelagia TaxID=931531 RepID=UPI00266553F7|nr:DNA mismatch repair endonuclease MutL [Tunicatimonas pelagia]WKN41616.1 DNA mismatch repair endonuclease MutL [Tunicatimonas pelagia]
MSDVIQLLPDAIANQIAAGEVVQRPASVVKELIENAIDAGGTLISLVVRDAGKGLIQVVDNGRGMSSTDARMCFERHATSKIRQTEDIYNIHTLGFRGEALASIAAVAQVELTTRRAEDELATRVVVEGSAFKQTEPTTGSVGTNICVKNLFYNIPARRSFLKSNSVEVRHIMDEFYRVVLARPDLGFRFFQSDKPVYDLPAGSLTTRISDLFTNAYATELLACDEETDHVRVTGLVGKPEFHKRTRGEQFFFVNQRYIKSNYLHHAVMSAYEAMLPEGSFPFYTLFLEIDPQHIDVNVHPTKTEIKFSDERTIYAIVRAAVKRSLGTNLVTPVFDEENHFAIFPTVEPPQPEKATTTTIPSRLNQKEYQSLSGVEITKRANLEHWESLYQSGNEKSHFDFPEGSAEENGEMAPPVTLQSAVNRTSDRGEMFLESEQKAASDPPFQVHHTYVAVHVKSGLMLIDQQAAHERILFEQYSLALEKKSAVSQQSLFPQTIQISPADLALLQELDEEIRAMGFVFTVAGNGTLVVQGVPPDVKTGTEQEVLEGIIEQYKSNQERLTLSKRDNMARSIARRMAMKAGQRLNEAEMRALIDRLFGCIQPDYAPDGRKTTYVLELEKIATFFTNT